MDRDSDRQRSESDERRRRAAYFQAYYLQHRERILAKNRLWAKQNAARVMALRRARRTRGSGGSDGQLDQRARSCAGCGVPMVRAERCRKCHTRYRYANDPQFRARRLATSRRWRTRRLAEA